MRILITGGGTGGHIYPALAIANRLREENHEILFVGAEEALDREIITREGFTFKSIPVLPLKRRFSFSIFKFGIKFIMGFFRAFPILFNFRPQLIVGTGGYSSAPVALAAYFLRIPLLIHEQNLYPGLTNRFLSRFAREIDITFPEPKEYFKKRKVKITGNPIRIEILDRDRKKALKNLKLYSGKFNLLVFGGSQGAKAINYCLAQILKKGLLEGKGLQIILLSGFFDFEYLIQAAKSSKIPLLIKPFLHNMADAYGAADLVISRAGATTLAELTACSLPAILIPYPRATRRHQEYNACFLAKEGAAMVILENDLSPERLADSILRLMEDRERLKKMRERSRGLGMPWATDRVVESIYRLGKKKAEKDRKGL
ncbi:undecaprenyldiphospho-muramoylpentapeptide beta-N-acetylglucosaminyltransferase [bacterium]|nr:undecaprenyldiphospho-muramoylpentapeptide beta-N-acetylglucosaminyltransferase [bacterium]MBU4560697.1 undecaprenyldiphospho-muramoylpentapeptide beta-N-acetylglucosaminyltransferase [bacterium]MCG2675750.1 undecaprenyldiphospho-muramoylpentapeptide beta-N-acetylglucosaminyltransferase [bacterium]MCG2678070.1 undecaprenyldiphospho-muramoylpentapeptide beta-N-acetylglucosaminyltransferase [bacterium]